MKKIRILSIMLTVVMVFTLICPASALADEFYIEEEIGEQEYFEDSWFEEVPLTDENLWIEEYIDEPFNGDEDSITDDVDNIFVEDTFNGIIDEDSFSDGVDNVFEEEEIISDSDKNDNSGNLSDAENTEDMNAEFTISDAESFFAAAFSVSAPEAVTVGAGVTATFHVEVNGGTAPYTYQWQYKAPGKTTWAKTSLNGCKTDTISFEAEESFNGRFFRCEVTDATGAIARSRGALLTIAESGSFSVSDPEDVSVKDGETATFHVDVTGGTAPYTYKWEYHKAGATAWSKTSLNGYKTDTLSFTAQESFDGRAFHCVVTDADGNTVTSGKAVLTIEKEEVIIDNVVYAKLSDSAMYVKAYHGSAASVIVLGEVNNLPVEEIGAEAFMGNTSLQSIDLPDSIKVIRERAFKNCINLKEMN